MANHDKIEQLRTRAQREVDEGLLPSCQLAVALDGKVVHHEAFGEASTDNRYVMFSATKPVVASAVWLLIQSGDLDVSKRVVDYIPEFASFGKDAVTVEQVMLHTSGFPAAPLGPLAWSTRAGRLERFGEWKLNFEPGTMFVYHPTSAHWVLAELLDRLTGVDYRRFIAEQITGPLGLADRLQVGVPVDQQGDITTLEKRGEPVSPDELERLLGIRELPVTEVTDDALIGFNEPDTRALGVPGGGGVTDAASMALFYQALLHNPAGIWKDDLLLDVTGNVRNHLPDQISQLPVERTLGLCTAGADGKGSLRGFGKTVSGRTFGHAGAAGQIAWADPESGISFCYLTNGVDANFIRVARRGTALSSIAGECA
ncbi:MAG TPA: serine hydrolase domain-containing protein [Acidimicrobiales bacterium]|nr:serine hydrolase domain-containing protein [Acidimicrobiales bacterium]